ncbi:MAG: hypothetical protein ACYSTJ_01185 [Planctomycetota bacterium]
MRMKRYWILAAIAAAFTGAFLGAKAFARLTEKQLSLSEIKAAGVLVQGLTEEAEKTGLKAEHIQAYLEERLKTLGIRVVSQGEAQQLAGSPVLYVNVSAYKRERRAAFVYHINVGLQQEVTLVRDKQIRTTSITWTAGRLGYCPASSFAQSARKTTEYLMDKFSVDYAAANPDAKSAARKRGNKQ